MPFRCTECLRLSASDSTPSDCEKKLHCEFERVAVIHLLTTEGMGKVLCRKNVKDPQDENKTTSVALKLGCESDTEKPIATAYYAGVTCLACRSNFLPEEPITEES